MNKLSLILIIIIAGLLLSGCIKSTNVEQEQPSTATNSDTEMTEGALIQIQHDGFKPEQLTVKVGALVTWVNNDAEPHWVISDPHPLHNILPSLDSKRGLEQKDIFQYRFDKVGTFFYHDELNIGLGGSVVVEK